jgi:hypothetical protein
METTAAQDSTPTTVPPDQPGTGPEATGATEGEDVTPEPVDNPAGSADADDVPEPWQAPDDGPSEEALLIASGLILLLLSGGSVARARSRRRRTPPGEHLGDRWARQMWEFLIQLGPRSLLPLPDRESLKPSRSQWRTASPEDTPDREDPPQPGSEALADHFAASVENRADQGYHVRNRTLIDKVWNSLRDPFWADPGSGQCGEYAEWGEEWTRGLVRDLYGPDAIVDTIVIEERSTVNPSGVRDSIDGLYRANHAATRVILPDGSRHVLDYWDALGRNRGRPSHLRDEADWIADWSAEIGEGVVDRSVDELTLRSFIDQYGPERGREAFRRAMAKHGKAGQAETLIRSWVTQPW